MTTDDQREEPESSSSNDKATFMREVYEFFCYLFKLEQEPKKYRKYALLTLVSLAFITFLGVVVGLLSLNEAKKASQQAQHSISLAIESNELSRRLAYFNAITNPSTPIPLVKDALDYVGKDKEINGLNIGNESSNFEYSFNGKLEKITDSMFRYSSIDFGEILELNAHAYFSDLVSQPKTISSLIKLYLDRSSLMLSGTDLQPNSSKSSELKLFRSSVDISDSNQSVNIKGVNCDLSGNALPDKELGLSNNLIGYFSRTDSKSNTLKDKPYGFLGSKYLFEMQDFHKYVRSDNGKKPMRTSGNNVSIINSNKNVFSTEGEFDVIEISDSSLEKLDMRLSSAIGTLTTLSNVETNIEYTDHMRMTDCERSHKVLPESQFRSAFPMYYPHQFFISNESNIDISMSGYQQEPVVLIIENSNVTVSGYTNGIIIVHNEKGTIDISKLAVPEIYTLPFNSIKCNLTTWSENCEDKSLYIRSLDMKTKNNINAILRHWKELNSGSKQQKSFLKSHFKPRVNSNVTIQDIKNVEETIEK